MRDTFNMYSQLKKKLLIIWSTQIGFNYEISQHSLLRGELAYMSR